jgi:hypothetical protein
MGPTVAKAPDQNLAGIDAIDAEQQAALSGP